MLFPDRKAFAFRYCTFACSKFNYSLYLTVRDKALGTNDSSHKLLGTYIPGISLVSLHQRSPDFLAPGTGFVEDNFSTDRGWGWGDGFWMIQAHYIYCALYFYYYYIVIYNEIIIQLTLMLTGGRAQAVMRAMGSGCKYRWSFAHSPAAHLLLWGLVPNRQWTSTGLWPGS